MVARLRAPLRCMPTRGDQTTLIKSLVLNHDGAHRCAAVHFNHSLKAGTYRLTFDGGLLQARGVQLPVPNFLNQVSLDFGVAHTDQHYHVPLLVSPWATRPTAARDVHSWPSVSVSTAEKCPDLSHSQVSV